MVFFFSFVDNFSLM